MKKLDDKKIGRNIKAIRNSYGINTLDFAEMLGISESTLQKLENGRKVPNEVLQDISRYSGYLVFDIKYTDLTGLKKKSQAYGTGFTLIEAFTDNDVIDIYVELFKRQFPFIELNDKNKSSNFAKGMAIVKEKIQSLNYTSQDCLDAINYFSLSSEDGLNEISSVNILSCFGYLYILSTGAIKEQQDTNSMVTSSFLFQYSLAKCIDDAARKNNRQVFLNNYNGIVTKHMHDLAISKEYYDYSYFYLFLRYDLGMLEEEIVKLTEEQMRLFSASMFDCLWKMGNKYAIALHDYIVELEKELQEGKMDNL